MIGVFAVLVFFALSHYIEPAFLDWFLGWPQLRSQLESELGGRRVDGGATLVCVLDGVEISLRYVRGGRRFGLRASVVCPARGRVRGDLAPGWFSGGDRPLTGDEPFDRKVALQGPELEAVAPLDAAARAAILRGVQAGVVFERGVASLAITVEAGPSSPVSGPLRLLVAASRPWREGEVGLRAGLCALAERDPVRMVRAWAVLRLSRLPGDAAAQAHRLATQDGLGVMDALTSPHPDEVTGAAVWLGLRGGVDAVPALRALAVAELSAPARLAVAEAVLAIQARAGPDAAGSLARVEGGGELSLGLVDELAIVRRDVTPEERR